MKIISNVSILLLSIFSSAILYASPITIVSQQDTWNYNQGTGLGIGIITGGFSTFSAGYTGANIGDAAFGNTGGFSGVPVQTTNWDAGTALYLQKTVDLNGIITGNATLNVAVDNGAAVFINGVEVFNRDAGGFTSIWEYTQIVSDSVFINGLNTISVIANDYGGATYFDMQLLGNIEPAPTGTPEPVTLLLMASGLLGLGYQRKKHIS